MTHDEEGAGAEPVLLSALARRMLGSHSCCVESRGRGEIYWEIIGFRSFQQLMGPDIFTRGRDSHWRSEKGMPKVGGKKRRSERALVGRATEGDSGCEEGKSPRKNPSLFLQASPGFPPGLQPLIIAVWIGALPQAAGCDHT